MKRVASDLSGELQITTKKYKRIPKLDESAEFEELQPTAKISENAKNSKTATNKNSENSQTAEDSSSDYDTVPFTTLPLDILLHILSFLSPSTSLPLAHSSKIMRKLFEAKQLWTNLKVGKEKDGEWIVTPETFCKLSKHILGHIESVAFETDLSESYLHQCTKRMAKNSKNLKTLVLMRCSDLTDYALSDIAEIKTIQNLSISNNAFIESLCSLTKLKKLQKIQFEAVRAANYFQFQKLLPRNKSIKIIKSSDFLEDFEHLDSLKKKFPDVKFVAIDDELFEHEDSDLDSEEEYYEYNEESESEEGEPWMQPRYNDAWIQEDEEEEEEDEEEEEEGKEDETGEGGEIRDTGARKVNLDEMVENYDTESDENFEEDDEEEEEEDDEEEEEEKEEKGGTKGKGKEKMNLDEMVEKYNAESDEDFEGDEEDREIEQRGVRTRRMPMRSSRRYKNNKK